MSTIYNVVHSPFGHAFGFHCDQWSGQITDSLPFFTKHTFRNIATAASWCPGLSIIVGLSRIIASAYILNVVDNSSTGASSSEVSKIRQELMINIGRGIIEVFSVGFILLMITDIGFTIARARNPCNPSAETQAIVEKGLSEY